MYERTSCVVIVTSIGKIDILGGYQRAWERAASLKIDAAGFHETHLLGYSGNRAPRCVVGCEPFWPSDQLELNGSTGTVRISAVGASNRLNERGP